MKGLLQKYLDQIVADYNTLVELYQIKIVNPMQLTIRQHIKEKGLFRSVFKFIITVLFKLPIWWPFLFVTYLWGLSVTYTMLPLVYWIEQKIVLEKKQEEEKKQAEEEKKRSSVIAIPPVISETVENGPSISMVATQGDGAPLDFVLPVIKEDEMVVKKKKIKLTRKQKAKQRRLEEKRYLKAFKQEQQRIQDEEYAKSVAERKKQERVPSYYEKRLYWVLELQWWLKTWLGFMHIVNWFYRGLDSVLESIFFAKENPMYWYYKVRNLLINDNGFTDRWLFYLQQKENQTKIKRNLILYLWYRPKYFVFNWLNPHKYRIFRLLFYKRNRARFYTWAYSRWLIRYKIFKGLVKYWIKGGLHMGGRRLMLRIKYIGKMIVLRCHLIEFYNSVVLKIYKVVFFVGKELIYIWTAVSLLIEIIMILLSVFMPLLHMLALFLFRLSYVIVFLLNFWFYNIIYSYEWYIIWLIKGQGMSHSLRAAKIQEKNQKLGLTGKKTMAWVELGDKKKPVVNAKPEYVPLIHQLKKGLKSSGNTIWRICFGQQAVLFVDKVTPVTKTEQKPNNQSDKKPPIRDMTADQDIWTKMWKACCPPMIYRKPEDVNSPNSKYRVEFKAGIKSKKKQEQKGKTGK